MASIRADEKDFNGEGHGSASANPDALGRADRLANLGQLAAGLAHEMNTPLGSISGHAEELLEIIEAARDGQVDRAAAQDIRARLMAIMRQANRCSRIATRLLQFAQAARPHLDHCHFRPVVNGVVELLASAAKKKGVHITSEITDDLPAAPLGEPEMEQILLNLLQNSLDACDHGGQIAIEASANNGHLSFSVKDTGSGIPRDVLDRVFDPFFTTKPVGQGTGLGLSVCHGIVQSVHGSIEIESAPDRGAQVTVKLPLEHLSRGARV